MVKPPGAQPTLRLTKGQKTNKKRMATVATVFTRAPWVRTPQQVPDWMRVIVRDLFQRASESKKVKADDSGCE
jgi:hypothetical protein